ncbi:acyl-CoA thioesterase [Amphritea pacifica]|uniref:acyl-CoA thioesterase n=1 Tax=Amphritea pacifica TaxID=2811233 RepID=UPI001962F2EB|nr:thioesterase family protein [Amphritea pacifica]MBN1006687.1 acyl-CoA thioesterase [Amphritea pacifica]
MSSEILQRFPISMEIPIAWGDMDAFQHVNNLVYLRWFESARIDYFRSCDFTAVMQETDVGPILRDSRIRYRIPLTFPGSVISACRVTRLEHDRYTMEHLIWSPEHNAVAAEGEGTIVCVNYRKNSKAEVPPLYRQRIIELEPITPEIFD